MSAPELEIAATVTRGTVRCSAWLGVSGLGLLFIGLCLLLKPSLHHWMRFDAIEPRENGSYLLRLLRLRASQWLNVLRVLVSVSLLDACYLREMSVAKVRYWFRLAVLKTCHWIKRRIMAGVYAVPVNSLDVLNQLPNWSSEANDVECNADSWCRIRKKPPQ